MMYIHTHHEKVLTNWINIDLFERQQSSCMYEHKNTLSIDVLNNANDWWNWGKPNNQTNDVSFLANWTKSNIVTNKDKRSKWRKKRKKVKCKISNIVVLFFINYTTTGLTKLIDFDLLCYFNVYNKKKTRKTKKDYFKDWKNWFVNNWYEPNKCTFPWWWLFRCSLNKKKKQKISTIWSVDLFTTWNGRT